MEQWVQMLSHINSYIPMYNQIEYIHFIYLLIFFLQILNSYNAEKLVATFSNYIKNKTKQNINSIPTTN